MTFNYNLARLNLDTRHTSAGYRYADERDDAIDAVESEDIDRVLRAEFTPTWILSADPYADDRVVSGVERSR